MEGQGKVDDEDPFWLSLTLGSYETLPYMGTLEPKYVLFGHMDP